MEIEWPSEGDKLFRHESGHYSACINWVHNRDKQGLYARSFESAAIHMIDHVTETRSELDTFIYPIIFCFRHSLELTLKDIINDGINLCENLKIDHVPKNHDLLQLWYLVKKIIIDLFPDEDHSILVHVENCMKEIDLADKTSMSFRYPTSKDGAPHLEGMKYIDMLNLKKTMKALLNFFSGVDSQISVVRDYILEMRAEMGSHE